MSSTLISFYFLLLIIIKLVLIEYSYAHKKKNVSALLVFGDSTVDPGNNNYISTMARGNHPPYGQDFPNHVATGRFSNGRLVTDFIAEFAGLKKNLPPYLDPNLTSEELMTGVSFASSAGGFDPLTSQLSGALTQTQQLDLFKEYKGKVGKATSEEKMNELMKKAVFIVSCGTNDFAINYFGSSLVRHFTFSNISQYQLFICHNIQQFLKGLMNEGAKTIAVVGVPPIGCLPAMITLYSNNPISDRKCIEYLNSVSRNFNRMLQNSLRSLQTPDTKIVYVDIYTPIMGMVQNKAIYGIEEVDKGCCGSGLMEADFVCNSESSLCDDVSKYIFWDAVHPTEKGYNIIFDSLRPLIQKYVT